MLNNSETVLDLKNLAVSFKTSEGEVQAVRGVDLTVKAGEILCIVGESGCGKTVLCQSIMHLLPKYSYIKAGTMEVCGRNITNFREKDMRKIRGKEMSMIFQDPLGTLNPTIPVGRQITEAIFKHQKVTRAQAKERAIELLRLVGISEPEKRYNLQPHFFSGGMRQRCVIAAALASEPKLLFSDEATTALDVTVESKILDLLLEIREKTGVAIVFITHDLGVVARIADRVAVMYAGKIVEIGTAQEVFYDPKHPYTWGLLSSLPSLNEKNEDIRHIHGMPPSLLDPPTGDAFAVRNPHALKIDYEEMPPMFKVSDTHYAATWLLDERAPKIESPIDIKERIRQLKEESEKNIENKNSEKENDERDVVLDVKDLKQHFQISSNYQIKAVDGVSFQIRKGEAFGLVGETGCGKSTVAKTLSGIYTPTDGTITYCNDLVIGRKTSKQNIREFQKNVQMIFQDSAASLNPRMTVEQIILEPLKLSSHRVTKQEAKKKLEEILESVWLSDTYLTKHPGELSGGQRQRVAIARSLITDPDLIIADEPIASLDISIQAQIMSLFQKLQQERKFSFLFIAHDLSAVRFISNRIGVMFRGRLVEVANTEELFANPLHPYTKALLSAEHIPDPDSERQRDILYYDPNMVLGDKLENVGEDHWVLQ